MSESVRARLFKRFVIDLPVLDLHPLKKPEFHGLWGRISNAIFGEAFLSRGSFIYRTYIARSSRVLTGAGCMLFTVAYLIRVAPPVHNWRLEKAYQDRYDRHLKYLEENPKYKKALVHAYNQLAPPK